MIGVLPDAKGYGRACQILARFYHFGCRAVFATPRLEYPEEFQMEHVDLVRQPDFGSLNRFLDARGEILDLVILSHLEVAAQHLYAVRRKAPRAFAIFDVPLLEFLRFEEEAKMRDDAIMRKKAAAIKKMELALMRATDQTWMASSDEIGALADAVADVDIALLPYPDDHAFQAEAQTTIQRALHRLQC